MAERLGAFLCFSAAGTLGTAYYLLSDGGDPDVARARIDHAIDKAKAATSSNRASDTNSSDSQDKKVDIAQAQRPDMNQWDGSTMLRPDSVLTYSSGCDRSEEGYFENNSDLYNSGCHHCSGPRIWFFADKLGVTRLKRRFTPYADPERDNA